MRQPDTFWTHHTRVDTIDTNRVSGTEEICAWPIGLYLDRSGRLAGTMYVSDLFGDRRRVVRDEWISGEAWRTDPDIGLFVILERAFVGLVPASEPHALQRGQAARFRVADTLPDGKLVLSLRQHAYQELAADAANILAALTRPHPPEVGDRSDSDAIRALFGLSKKAFKRAVGHLLKHGAVTIDRRGFVVANGSEEASIVVTVEVVPARATTRWRVDGARREYRSRRSPASPRKRSACSFASASDGTLSSA